MKVLLHPLRILLTLGTVSLCGCGYQISGSGRNDPGYQWKTLYRDDVRTVAVPTFGNRSFSQGFEFRLTKAVINQIEAQSPYKVVPREEADTILEGEITGVRMRTTSDNYVAAVPQEQMYSILVRFTWRDLRTGKILVERHDFEQTAPFYPTLGEDPFVGEQSNIERLALAIVQELQADWGSKKK
ncbi:MAG TPA: LptE family protein [Tepidisphaeraceae bacterium]|nr:LptE family protein [Tepidisphaeraceae bacterium]